MLRDPKKFDSVHFCLSKGWVRPWLDDRRFERFIERCRVFARCSRRMRQVGVLAGAGGRSGRGAKNYSLRITRTRRSWRKDSRGSGIQIDPSKVQTKSSYSVFVNRNEFFTAR